MRTPDRQSDTASGNDRDVVAPNEAVGVHAAMRDWLMTRFEQSLTQTELEARRLDSRGQHGPVGALKVASKRIVRAMADPKKDIISKDASLVSKVHHLEEKLRLADPDVLASVEEFLHEELASTRRELDEIRRKSAEVEAKKRAEMDPRELEREQRNDERFDRLIRGIVRLEERVLGPADPLLAEAERTASGIRTALYSLRVAEMIPKGLSKERRKEDLFPQLFHEGRYSLRHEGYIAFLEKELLRIQSYRPADA